MPEDATMKAESWTSARVYDALMAKYSAPEYALLFEVPDGTGMNKCRSADALAMSLWPSRGLHLIGFEVKVSRSDWVREKANPAKAEAIARFCDYWYVVAGSKSIVGPGELPPTWGLLAPRGGKLVVSVEAPKLAPKAVDADLLAGIFRRASEKFQFENIEKEAISRARSEGFKEGQAWAEQVDASGADRSREDLARLRRSVSEFEEASGLRLSEYSGNRKLGEAVRVVMHGGVEAGRSLMRRLRSDAENLVSIAAAYEELAKMEEPDHA